MIDIAAHIGKLVREHELVIIPNLGGFLTNFHSSVIHHLSDRIEPAGRHIAFNSRLKENDGLLAHYFAQKANLSYKDALSLVEAFAESCDQELKDGKNISFENLGVLSLNSQGYIEFLPDLNINYADEYFGLPNIIAAPIQRNKEYKPVIQLHPDAKQKIKKNAIIIRRIAAVAIPFFLIGLLAFFTRDQIKSIYQQPASIINLNTDSQKKINNTTINTDLVLKEENTVKENTSKTTSSDTVVEESSGIILEETPIITLGHYHIICGAFNNKDLADALISRLKSEGFEPYIAGQNNIGLYRVSFANFSNRNKAVEQLRWFQANRNKSAWLLDADL